MVYWQKLYFKPLYNFTYPILFCNIYTNKRYLHFLFPGYLPTKNCIKISCLNFVFSPYFLLLSHIICFCLPTCAPKCTINGQNIENFFSCFSKETKNKTNNKKIRIKTTFFVQISLLSIFRLFVGWIVVFFLFFCFLYSSKTRQWFALS